MRKNKISKFITYLAVGASAALSVQQASAVTELEEIIVTAQKRQQSLNDVGIAVTAFTGDSLRELGITQPLDIAAQTPNLNINNTFGNSIPNISIRGLGLNDYAVNNNPAAGVYVDEVYLVSPAMLTFQLFDLERVEVLKGPQGTLYGRNTTAGAVNFISKKPTSETEGYLSANVGNFDLFSIEGAVSGKVGSNLNGRISVKTDQQGEGHQFNRATGQDVGEVDRTSWRGLLNWQPSDNLDLSLNLHGGRDESDTHLIKVNNSLIATDDAFSPGDPFNSSGRPDTFVDIESNGASLNVNWAYSDQLTFTSVTGYEDYSRQHVEDRDGSELQFLDGEFFNEIEQFSQEFRVTYDNEGFVLIAGAFYGNDEINTTDRFDAPLLLGAPGSGLFSVGNTYTQESDSTALFLHSEWQFGDSLKLTAGLRYTDEEKEFRDASSSFFTQAGVEIPLFAPVTNNYEVSDVSGKLGLDYSGFENTLLYASYSNGFKSGNFQGQLAFNPNDLGGFDEESVDAFELGFKSQLLNNSLQLNGALFFYQYEDIQIYGPIFDSPLGPLFGIDNAGDADVTGAELDMLWRASDNLDVRLGLGLLDTEITRVILPGVSQGSVLPNSPEVNFNANVKYSWALNTKLTADVMLDTSYKDDVTYDIVRSPAEAVEDGYWLTNVRLGVTSADGDWGVHLWAKNLSDEEYRTQVLFSSVGFGESYGMPRTYGVSVDYNW